MKKYIETKYTFHHMWETRLMKSSHWFFRHGVEESKICPLGNVGAFFLAAWVVFRDFSKRSFVKLNTIIFSIVMILSFIMNLNSFIYFIPVFIYELL